MSDKIEFTEDEDDLLRVLDGYEIVHDALAYSEMIDLLPDDPSPLLDRIEREIPEDPVQKINKLVELAKTDVEFFNQYFALQVLLKEEGFEEKEDSKIEKIDSDAIKKAKEDELYAQVLQKLKEVK